MSVTGTVLSAVLAAATWTDASGRVTCRVPDGFKESAPSTGRFARADGKARLDFVPFVPKAKVASAQHLAAELLSSAGASDVDSSALEPKGAFASGMLAGPPDVAVTAAIVEAIDGYAGAVAAVAAGQAGAGDLVKRAATSCRFAPPPPPPAPPLIVGGRVFEARRRASFAIPPGIEAFEQQGTSGLRGEGWRIDLPAARPVAGSSLTTHAERFASAAGARGARASATQIAGHKGALASGAFSRSGRDYQVESAAIALTNDVVGVVLVTDAETQIAARQAFLTVLGSLQAESAEKGAR